MKPILYLINVSRWKKLGAILFKLKLMAEVRKRTKQAVFKERV